VKPTFLQLRRLSTKYLNQKFKIINILRRKCLDKEVDVFKFIKKHIAPHSRYILYALLLHVVWTIFINMQSYITKIIIDSLIGTQPKDILIFIGPVMLALLFNIIITRFSRIYLDNIFFLYLPIKLKKNIRLHTITTCVEAWLAKLMIWQKESPIFYLLFLKDL
jgi:ABC-type bacteriocin/lantibiotic exporter with double-glycine peptidase domain